MTYSFVHASDFIGKDVDKKKKMIQLLIQSSPNEEENVSILPLVEIGGLGKTTLTKLAYNDERVVRNFEKRMWICVSDEFDVARLINEIITSSTHDRFDGLPIEKLQLRLRSELNDNKFLLILDDMWNTNHYKWLKLKALIDGVLREVK